MQSPAKPFKPTLEGSAQSEASKLPGPTYANKTISRRL